MLEPERDQALRKAQRDQPLRRGARDLEDPGDLVLGVSGDEIEPTGAGGIIEARFLALRRDHETVPIDWAKNRPFVQKRDRRPHWTGAFGRRATDSGCRR